MRAWAHRTEHFPRSDRTIATENVSRYEDLIGPADALPAMSGRAWVFGDRICGRHVLADEHLYLDPIAASAFAMASLDPGFARKAAAGDFIVAGIQFAAETTQPIIPAALKSLGIAAVIARSFEDFFLRAATHLALPALIVEETAAIKGGDRLRVDIEAHIVANLSSGDRYVIRNVDDATIGMLRAGGVARP